MNRLVTVTTTADEMLWRQCTPVCFTRKPLSSAPTLRQEHMPLQLVVRHFATGDKLLYITGKPYDTLEDVIGSHGGGNGSLADFNIDYEHVPLKHNAPTGSALRAIWTTRRNA